MLVSIKKNSSIRYDEDHYLDKVWHGKVHDVVFPRQLKNYIGMQQIIALEQACSKTIICFVLQEIC